MQLFLQPLNLCSLLLNDSFFLSIIEKKETATPQLHQRAIQNKLEMAPTQTHRIQRTLYFEIQRLCFLNLLLLKRNTVCEHKVQHYDVDYTAN